MLNITFFLLDALLLGLCAGVVAAVYRGVLAYEPVLNWWFKWGNNFEKYWFFRPVWGCLKCIAGQVGLWSYLLVLMPGVFAKYSGTQPGGVAAKYMVINPFAFLLGLLLVICTAILTAILLNFVIQKVENNN